MVTRNGTVYALDAATGATRWKDTAAASTTLPPVMHDGILFVEDGSNLLAYDARAARRLGKFPAGRLKAAPVSAGDRIYCVRLDDVSGRDELSFFQAQAGPPSYKLRVTQPQWSISIVPNENEY